MQPVRLVLLVAQVRLVHKDQQAPQAQLVLPVPQEVPVLQVLQGLQAQIAQCLVQQDQPVQLALQEPLEPQERRVQLGQLVQQEVLEQQVLRVLKVLRDQLALRVQLVPQVLQALLDRKAQQVQPEQRVQPVLRVQVLRRCQIF